MNRPQINKETVDLVKRFEGLRLNAYIDPVGIPTIGYGLTTGALDGVVVRMGMTISEKEAEEYLTRVMEKFANTIWPMFERQPTENQFGAMLSLAYNIGTGAFSRSTALRRFNAGDIEGAAEAIKWWNKGTVNGRKVVLRGLTRRRAAEVELFLNEEEDRTQVVRNEIEENKPTVPKEVEDVVNDADKVSYASTTNWSQIGQAAGSIGIPGVLTALGQMDWKIAVPIMVIAAGAIVWVVYERSRKARMARKAKSVVNV